MFVLLARIANQLFKGYLKPYPVIKSKDGLLGYNVPFRCWPVDLDGFLHMNNANYLRVAELARWAIFVQSDTLRSTVGSGILFLAVENKVSYLKPIPPMQKYYVHVTLTSQDNKWIYYKHVFQSHPAVEGNDLTSGDQTTTPPTPTTPTPPAPTVYAVVECKAVLKERNGRTVTVDRFVEKSAFYQTVLTHNDKLNNDKLNTDKLNTDKSLPTQ
eukprot:gene2400-2633_t